MANGGFGQGFGQAWSQSLKMNREREEKERKKDRRNMWMMQLVGAPVAKGITEGVVGLINEPFKDSALNFFNTEQGKALTIKENEIAAASSKFKTRQKQIETSEKTPNQYHTDLHNERLMAGIDAKFQEKFGAPEVYEKLASYNAAKSQAYEEALKLGQAETVEYEAGYKALFGATTKAQKAKALKDHNPFSDNWGKATVRQIGRWIRGQSFEDFKKQRVDQYAKAAGLDDISYNNLKNSLGTAVDISDTDIKTTIGEIIDKNTFVLIRLERGTSVPTGSDQAK